MVRAAPALGRRDAVTASLPAGDLAEHDLGRLVSLGSGGEGDVFALPDHPGYVYKRYLTSETPNGAALSALMTLRARMAPADRSLVDEIGRASCRGRGAHAGGCVEMNKE